MDIILTIKNNRITTDLYKKNLNLYLYILPHSAHPLGVLTRLVLGNCYHIYTLCSEPSDVLQHLQQFYLRLKLHGYTSAQLRPLFRKAADLHKMQQPAPTIPGTQAPQNTPMKTSIFLHQRYHPNDIRSKMLQKLWQSYM